MPDIWMALLLIEKLAFISSTAFTKEPTRKWQEAISNGLRHEIFTLKRWATTSILLKLVAWPLTFAAALFMAVTSLVPIVLSLPTDLSAEMPPPPTYVLRCYTPGMKEQCERLGWSCNYLGQHTTGLPTDLPCNNDDFCFCDRVLWVAVEREYFLVVVYFGVFFLLVELGRFMLVGGFLLIYSI